MDFLGCSPTTGLLVGAAIILLYLYSTWTFSTLKKLGIPGPSPWPLFGNMLGIIGGLYKADMKWIKKHGKIFGAYEGRSPMLVIADPEMCKQICVKHFSTFVNRKILPLKSRPLDSGLTQLVDDQWKSTRNTLTPSFSSAKMRLMSPLIEDCANALVKRIEEHCKEGKVVQCKDLFGCFVTDSIGSAAFGLEVNSQTQPGHPFVENAQNGFQFTLFKPVIFTMFFLPFLIPIMNYFHISIIPSKITNYFARVTEDAIEMKKAGDGSNRVDFLQLMINARDVYDNFIKNKEHEQEGDEGENRVEFVKDDASSAIKLHKGFTKDEILAQSLLFILAGYETTTTLMSFVCYNLATNPEVQQRLQSEIDDVMESYDSVGYDALCKMEYLDMVVSETLRIFPPAIRFDRESKEDVNINGIDIPKGMIVNVSVYGIHHDPDNYPQPEKFIPERFTKEEKAKRHPYAWIPFGAGPRMCIGMRFALMEAKIGLVRVLQKFSFEPCAETEIPPNLGKVAFLSPPNGVKLRVKSRD